MPDFEVYVDDDRYSIPSLYLITASNEARARVLAEELWLSSDHHRGVELRHEGERIAVLGSLNPPAPAANDREAETL